MRDATDWSTHWRKRKTVDDPRRPVSAAEILFPGDVLDDGSIFTTDGLFMVRGEIWLSAKQAQAAMYYGWRILDRKPGLDRDRGTVIVVMGKE